MLEQLRTVPWYDRNPKSVLQRYVATDVAPHATTTRWTYTVPKGKKAFIEYIGLLIQRITVAAPVDQVTACIDVGVEGAGALSMMAVILITNVIGDSDRDSIGQSLTLKEGDVLRCSTTDLGTGGTMRYLCVAKITEFDAFPLERLPFQVELPKRDVQEPGR